MRAPIKYVLFLANALSFFDSVGCLWASQRRRGLMAVQTCILSISGGLCICATVFGLAAPSFGDHPVWDAMSFARLLPQTGHFMHTANMNLRFMCMELQDGHVLYDCVGGNWLANECQILTRRTCWTLADFARFSTTTDETLNQVFVDENNALCAFRASWNQFWAGYSSWYVPRISNLVANARLALYLSASANPHFSNYSAADINALLNGEHVVQHRGEAPILHDNVDAPAQVGGSSTCQPSYDPSTHSYNHSGNLTCWVDPRRVYFLGEASSITYDVSGTASAAEADRFLSALGFGNTSGWPRLDSTVDPFSGGCIARWNSADPLQEVFIRARANRRQQAWSPCFSCYPPRPGCVAVSCKDHLQLQLGDDNPALSPFDWVNVEILSSRCIALLFTLDGLFVLKVLLQWRGWRVDARRDFGKKSLNLWTLTVPMGFGITLVGAYQIWIISALEVYSYREPIYGTFTPAANGSTSDFSHRTFSANPTPGGSFWMLCAALSLYIPCIVIECIIPAGKHARAALPPPQQMVAVRGVREQYDLSAVTTAADGPAALADEGVAAPNEGEGAIGGAVSRVTESLRLLMGMHEKRPAISSTSAVMPPPPPAALGLSLSALPAAAKWGDEWRMASMHAGMQALEAVARCLTGQAWHESTKEPAFFVMAWEGPKAGESNDTVITLSELRELHAGGQIPGDAFLYESSNGTTWVRVDQVLK